MERIAIILGKYLNDDGSMPCELVERAYAGYRLYIQKKVDRLLLCGGRVNAKAGKSEAQAMADYLIARGVQKEDCLLEEKSKNTYENAKYCREILKNREKGDRYLVTSSKHMYRSYYNPVRFFNWMFHLRVKLHPSTDWNLELPNGFFQDRDSLLVVYKKKDKLPSFGEDKNVFLKKWGGVVRKGALPTRYQTSLENMLILTLREMYGVDAIEVLNIRGE